MPFNLQTFLLVGAALFVLGVVTVITRRNAICILMGIELILNAASLNFVAFSFFLEHPFGSYPVGGQVVALFIVAIAAAEVAIALAIILSSFSHMKNIDVEEMRQLRG